MRLVFPAMVLLTVASCAVAAEKDSFARLELRGKLVATAEAREGTSGYAVQVNDLTFHLVITGDATDGLRKLAGKTVMASGAFEKRRGPGGQILDVCVLAEGDLIVAGNRYLIGYKDGDGAPLAELAREVSLKVVDNYRPGKYLVVEVTPDTKASFVSRLKASPNVRYVEPDTTYRAEK